MARLDAELARDLAAHALPAAGCMLLAALVARSSATPACRSARYSSSVRTWARARE